MHQQRRTENNRLDNGKGDSQQFHRSVVGHRYVPWIRGEQDLEQVGQRDGYAERDQQRHEVRPFNDPIDQHVLEHVPEQEHQRQDQQQRGEGVHPEVPEQTPPQIGADHQIFSVREVDDAHHPPDDGESQDHYGIETAEQQAVDKCLQNLVHGAAAR